MSELPVENGRGSARAALLPWHRRVGVTLAVVLVLVAATGVLLNHAEGLGLRGIQVKARWLYRWYGMEPTGPMTAFDLEGRRAVWLDGSLYLDAKPVARLAQLRGAVALTQAWVAAGDAELLVLTKDGELIERLAGAAVPPGQIARVGVSDGVPSQLAIETADRRTFVYDANLVKWGEAPVGIVVTWSRPAALPTELSDQLMAQYRGEGLSVHRVLLDLHSGRFFGRAGIVIVDLAGAGMLFLTITGLVMALRLRRK